MHACMIYGTIFKVIPGICYLTHTHLALEGNNPPPVVITQGSFTCWALQVLKFYLEQVLQQFCDSFG